MPSLLPMMLGGDTPEVSSRIPSHNAEHTIRMYGKISPETVLMHQVRAHLFSLVVGSSAPLIEVERKTISRMIPRY